MFVPEAAVVIPAYNPGPELPQLVGQLLQRKLEAIAIVDDGSGVSYRQYFDEAAAWPGVRILRHAVNLGKGAALKTGINAVLCDYPDIGTLVTADADGQHHPDDILAVAKYGAEHRHALVLGARRFSRGVPFRSRLGNGLTKWIMRFVIGQRLSDTQTGLRCIPSCLRATLLQLPHQGYEFELDMLLECRKQGIAIAEIPIRTIYIAKNKSSHFNPVFDSMRIYFVLLRFAAVSFVTSALDNLVFSAVFFAGGGLALSQASGRVAAVLFNFNVVTRVVFQTTGHRTRQLVEYLMLVMLSGAASYGLIRVAVAIFGMKVLVAKIGAESLLFLVNFLVQRDVIFTGRPRAAS